MKFRRFWPPLLLLVVLWPLMRDGQWGAFSFSLGTGVAVGLLTYPARLQAALLRSLRLDETRDTSLDEWPQLHRAAWEEAARAWHELGFEPGAMQVRGESAPKLGITVSQLWQRAEQDAGVEISQTFLPARATPPTSAIYSFWGDVTMLESQAQALHLTPAPNAPIASPLPVQAPQATLDAVSLPSRLAVISFSTHDRPPHWIYNLFLHPQLLGVRLTGQAPATLWQTHQKRCEVVSQALGETPLRGDLVPVVRAQACVMHAIWRQQFKRRFLFQFWHARRRGTSKTETWGELEAQIRALDK